MFFVRLSLLIACLIVSISYWLISNESIGLRKLLSSQMIVQATAQFISSLERDILNILEWP